MTQVVAMLGEIGLVPVVKLDRAADAVPLGEALIAGGLPCAEITFRTAAAEEAIARLAAGCPDLLLGAGTVLTVDQAERAVGAGARFIVSPGFSPAVVDWCLSKGVPVLPGVVTPTEMMAALEQRRPDRQVLPGGGLRRHRHAEGAQRAVRRGQVHADRRHQRQQPGRLSELAVPCMRSAAVGWWKAS